ncbi:magnesium-translocating P-type ATPase [Sinomonas atrocyanea]|uniref:magnesium-translocating P-type ATPase n=1 Tax=Sinomonas atrocyanea TaxID=37927 RepID=UPI00116FB734|nr:magnesium-translocating P-type ATPase [Sinomonas atrocyanea]GEB64499.1 magnesium-translocating P-type ATPase [Sinomonas atrocyanea]GGG64524.1 magnesium-translocating P-type ATPase [Sinomonas atrocyanea]
MSVETVSERVQLAVAEAAAMPPEGVLSALGTSVRGLDEAEAARRLAQGANVLEARRVSWFHVLVRQFASPLQALLVAAAGLSYATGDQLNASIIVAILLGSALLGFANEFRAEKTAADLHSQISHTVVAVRGGTERTVPVRELVPGDIIRVSLGGIVPADARILESVGLETDEGVLTGESAAVEKSPEAVPPGSGLADLTDCVLMGTVVHAGSAHAVVTATGRGTEFGRIAAGLAQGLPETAFQHGLKQFSLMLLWVGIALTAGILVINLLLQRPFLDSVLFALAIAVGITPQLLPAVVSTSLAAGSRLLAKRGVLVKRLLAIEDLGNLDVLITDKTGTLTEGRIGFEEAVPAAALAGEGDAARRLAVLAVLCCEADPSVPGASGAGQNPVDAALWEAFPDVPPALAGRRRLSMRPFDHETRTMETVVAADGRGEGAIRILKGAPEAVLDACVEVAAADRTVLQTLFRRGARVVAVASGPVPVGRPSAVGAGALTLDGYLCFIDRPKADARESLARLGGLGVDVKIATGDNALVAEYVMTVLKMRAGTVLTGAEVEVMDDAALAAAAPGARVFARVSPEQKARIVTVLRRTHSVGFLGDGVNDALALNRADVGISVDSATDVAKDAADVVLLEKDLDVLADGVTGGRRIFANTIKYLLMGTSSNFGNMFSAAAASAFLTFLPMLPGQILLNNLLYDSSQLAIPTDKVDREQLRKPAHWDIGAIRRFMVIFGPISSLFDFATFGLMLWVFHAAPEEFRAGWFVESLATQTLIVFAIRTRRIPFLRSRASVTLTVGVLTVVAVGAVLPYTPVGALVGFWPLPANFFLALVGMVLLYLVLVEAAKHFYYRAADARLARESRARAEARVAARAALGLHHNRTRVHRRAAPFIVHTARPKFRRPPGHGIAAGRR